MGKIINMSEKKSFKESVAQVKCAYNIVEYIQSSGVSLRSAGATKWKGLCPFHNEKTPSFTVDETFQNYRCFGCGAHGDLINYVEKKENLEFFDALKRLADDRNIPLEFDGEDTDIDFRSLRSCVRETANFFYKAFRKLPPTHPAVKEITSRKLSPKKLYGYAPENRQALYQHLKGKGFSDDIILQAGVCFKSSRTEKIYDFWNGRLMFFITDITGRPVGFSGRKLFEDDKRGKYVNSPEGPLFDKSSLLYNLNNARKEAAESKMMYVTEGQFDVAAVDESGIPNVVASSGTAFTKKQGLALLRLVTEDGKIVFCFDGDSAGRKAALKVFESVPEIHAQAYVVTFPNNLDPCDYRQEYGAEKLKDFVSSSAVPMVEFILSVNFKDSDMSSEVGRTRYVERVAPILKTIPNPVLREAFIKKVALESFASVDVVRDMVAKATGGPQTKDKPEEEPSDIEEENRPEIDDSEFDQEALISLIEEDSQHNLIARIVALSFMNRKLIPYTFKLRRIFPDDMKWIIDDAVKLDGKPLVPELFTYSKVAEYIMDKDFFPFASMMNSEMIKKQYLYLRETLIKNLKESSEKEVHSSMSRILEAANDSGADFLEDALNRERQILEQDVSL